MRRYPWHLGLRLTSRVENGQIREAHEDLDVMLDLLEERYVRSLPVRKLLCAELIVQCLRAAHATAASSEALIEEHQQMLMRIVEKRRWNTLRQEMHDYIDSLIAHTRHDRTSDVERFVAWMRTDMQQSLTSPKTLAEYADLGEISTGHLSRTFAALTGLTFRETLRQMRLKEAKRLLSDTRLKIQAVAANVGLKDVSQFIRFFRIETGLTPVQYRRSHSRTEDK